MYSRGFQGAALGHVTFVEIDTNNVSVIWYRWYSGVGRFCTLTTSQPSTSYPLSWQVNITQVDPGESHSGSSPC
ncbi:MAG TPA: hypothetical protein VFB12_31025 [Ktedonobacteraceae bacterium]|nr:hypothetical protein [Ktedonobacteraceae bacterium]